MAVYVIGSVTVTDPSWIEEYGPAVDAMVQANGGKYIVHDLEPNHLEGGDTVPTVNGGAGIPDRRAGARLV